MPIWRLLSYLRSYYILAITCVWCWSCSIHASCVVAFNFWGNWYIVCLLGCGVWTSTQEEEKRPWRRRDPNHRRDPDHKVCAHDFYSLCFSFSRSKKVACKIKLVISPIISQLFGPDHVASMLQHFSLPLISGEAGIWCVLWVVMFKKTFVFIIISNFNVSSKWYFYHKTIVTEQLCQK